MLEQVAETTPIILATHSDRLLDALSDPQRSVVLCNLDSKLAAQLQRPDVIEAACAALGEPCPSFSRLVGRLAARVDALNESTA
jgi:hypothetical protein